MAADFYPGVVLFFAGSTVNLAIIWPARRWQIALLALVYHAMLATAFAWPKIITPGIDTGRGHLLPGPTLAGMLALLAIEAAAMAAVRLEAVAGIVRAEMALKTAIAVFGVFVVECVLAIVVMAWLNLGMY